MNRTADPSSNIYNVKSRPPQRSQFPHWRCRFSRHADGVARWVQQTRCDETARREWRASEISLNCIVININECIFFYRISEEKELNGHNDASDENKVSDCDKKDEDVTADVVADSPSVEFTIIHNKDKYNVAMPLSSTIGQLKDKLVDMIGVPSKMQKIMIKGLAKDDQTLESLNVSSSSKIMVVGAKLQDIVAVSVANVEEVCETIAIVLNLFWSFLILTILGLEYSQF